MTMYSGRLLDFTASTKSTPIPQLWPLAWTIDAKFERESHSAISDSRIVLAVLETALLKRQQWDVELDTAPNAAGEAVVAHVRVQDDRINYCRGTFNDLPEGIRVRPFSPTAFANEPQPKWGFFFYDPGNNKCREYKGTSLDVYAILEEVWYNGRTALLTFDSSGLIIGAQKT